MKVASDTRPDPNALLRSLYPDRSRRSLLRVYLGYAPGCGTTTAMLDEARRRAGRGTDVVVGAYRVHGNAGDALQGLELVGAGRARPAARALDLGPVLARNPEVVCVDDLAAPASTGLPVFEVVPRLLAAGITVLSSLHMLSIAGTSNAFESMFHGSPQPGRLIDDAFLVTVDEFELVDIPPTDLLTRLRDTPTLTPAELARAMQTELRPPVLKALRESAFRLVAEQSDRQLVGYLRERQMAGPWEGRGHVVLALQAAPGQEGWIRRIASYAASQDARFSVATVRTRPLSPQAREWMGAYASLTHQLGGQFVHLHGRSVAPTLIAHLQDDLATEVVVGHRRHGRWRPGDTTSRVIEGLSGVDVHVLRADAG